MNTINAAKYLFHNFGFSVIPILPKDKRPAIDSWMQFQRRRMTDVEVDKYFKPDSNIALITGEISGVDVLDLDSYKSNFKDTIIDSKLKVSTPRGGTHLYFKHKVGLRPGVNSEHAIDLRTDGSYVLIPPSVGSNGVSYKWVNGLSKSSVSDLSQIPDFISKEFEVPNALERSFNINESIEVSEGERNVKLHKAAVSLFSKHDEETAIRLIESLNRSYNPPLPVREVQAIIKSAGQFVRNNPPLLSRRRDITSQVTHSTEFKDELRFSKAGFDLPKWKVLKTGIPKIDSIYQFVPGFHLIVGSPGIGKGWFATWLIRTFWNLSREKSVFFSLEMGKPLLTKRLLQQWSGQSEDRYSEEKAQGAKELLKTDVLIIDFLSERTPENFVKRFEKYYSEGYKVFLFDHFHQTPGAKSDNKTASEQWGSTFEQLRNKYTDIYLLVFAQPNKATYSKIALQMSDVYESGALIEKADSFLSLSYSQRREINDNADTLQTDRNRIFWIDKNRLSGSSGVGARIYFGLDGNFYEKESDSFMQEPTQDNNSTKDPLDWYRKLAQGGEEDE